MGETMDDVFLLSRVQFAMTIMIKAIKLPVWLIALSALVCQRLSGME
jgi:hypothetical protein